MKRHKHQEVGQQNLRSPTKIRRGCENSQGLRKFSTLVKMEPSTCKTVLHGDERLLQRKHNSNE